MASALFSLIVGASILLCLYLYLKYTYWKRKGIPSPAGCYPFVGHMLPVLTMRKSYPEMVREIYDDHKTSSMVGLYKGMRPILIVREPQLVKTVLQTNFSNFHDNAVEILPELDPLIAQNPFINYGETWMAGRKRLTYAFSSSRLKTLFITVSEVCKKMQDYLNRRLSSKDKYEIELKYLFSKFTGEVVANAGLGIEGHCFEDKDDPNAFDQIGQSMFSPNFIQGFIMTFLMLFPKWNRLTRFKFVPKNLEDIFRQIVQQNLESRRKEPAPRNDFLQLMLDLEKSGEKLDLEAVTSHTFSFYNDGYQSSSMTLVFVGYQLAVHQDVQERVRDEVKTVMERHGGALTYEGLKEMTYIDQVINETLRCFPGVGTMQKRCTEKFDLEGSDGLKYHAKPGAEIVIPVYALQSDSKYWPDPETFDPERFNEEAKRNNEKFAFIPFGEGPRMCVGMRMAMLQMKACIATLIKDYKIELSPKTKLPLKLSPVIFLPLPIGGTWVYISKL